MGRSANPAASFESDGVAGLGRVLDDDQLMAVRSEFSGILNVGVTGPYASIVHDGWRQSAELARLVPHIGALTCASLGIPELVLFHDHLLSKPPGGADMEWHQDFSYLPLDRPDGLTLWIALDDIDAENGCLYYVLGSHLLGERRASWGLSGEDDPRAKLPPLEVNRDQTGVAIPARAGCALAHHTCVWHRSPKNRSSRPRRSWALSFVSPEARWSPRHAPHPRSAVEPRVEGQPIEDDLIRVRAAGLSALGDGLGTPELEEA